MQAVIFCAGRGTRLKEITDKTPKSLLLVQNKPILGHILNELPPAIDEIFLVVGYLQQQIKDYVKNKFSDLNIQYIEQKKLNGTFPALALCAPHLHDNPFLVLGGDDLIKKSDIEKIISYPLALGIQKQKPKNEKMLSTLIDAQGYFKGFEKVKNLEEEVCIATGTYVLNKKIFEYKPVQLQSGEYGLPQTIALMAKNTTIHTVIMPSWFQINTPKDLQRAHSKS